MDGLEAEGPRYQADSNGVAAAVSEVTMPKQPPCPTEHQEQAALFKWAAVASAQHSELELLHAIPNGAYLHSGAKGWSRLQCEGVKVGVFDVLLPVARDGNHGLYIEMKRRRGSTTSKAQLEFQRKVRQQGYRATICHGWEEARDLLLAYLEGSEMSDNPFNWNLLDPELIKSAQEAMYEASKNYVDANKDKDYLIQNLIMGMTSLALVFHEFLSGDTDGPVWRSAAEVHEDDG